MKNFKLKGLKYNKGKYDLYNDRFVFFPPKLVKMIFNQFLSLINSFSCFGILNLHNYYIDFKNRSNVSVLIFFSPESKFRSFFASVGECPE